MQGYLHPLYANSFSEIGEPVYLPKSRGWLIKRPILGTPYFDAMGPYPLFFCEKWDLMADDLEDLKGQLISASLVIGPFEKFSLQRFENYFDICRPYKDHYIYDTNLSMEQSISKYSRRDARRALQDVSVDIVVAPHIDLDEWVFLYDFLIKRHQIKGIRAFSKGSFAKQISIPSTHFFRAFDINNDLVAGNLYYIQNDVAYGHLLAITERGYQLGASHAIEWEALRYFQNIVRWVDFGGSTGGSKDELTGLDKFKIGWTNTIRKSYFCGKILDRDIYDEISKIRGTTISNWFPAYRSYDY